VQVGSTSRPEGGHGAALPGFSAGGRSQGAPWSAAETFRPRSGTKTGAKTARDLAMCTCACVLCGCVVVADALRTLADAGVEEGKREGGGKGVQTGETKLLHLQQSQSKISERAATMSSQLLSVHVRVVATTQSGCCVCIGCRA
jgi:hypothetical protein